MTLQEIDDADSRISYSGTWTAYIGGTQSSRQWESSIHSTNQNGASATITFIGTRISIFCTVPSGSGTNSIGIITFDGQRLTPVTRTTRSDAVYADLWYDSGDIANVQHTITISNGGSSSDSPLQFDRFQIEGDVVTTPNPPVVVTSSKSTSSSRTRSTSSPNTNSSAVSSSSSSTSTGSSQSDSKSSSSASSPSSSSFLTSASASSASATRSSGDRTITAVEVVTTAADGTVSTQLVDSPIRSDKQSSASSSPPIGAIVGAVVGSLVILAIVLLLLCLRRRRRRQGRFLMLGNPATTGTSRLTGVTPFNLAEVNTGTSIEPSADQSGNVRDEKAAMAAVTTPGEPSSPSDELVDLALRRWIERNPDILLNRSVLLSAYAGQLQTNDGPHDNRRQNMSAEDVELGTFSSMYASTVGGSSLNSNDLPPPSYQSSSKNHSGPQRQSKSPASLMLPVSPLSPSVPTQI